MNARIVQLVPQDSGEKRRARTMADMRCALHASGIELARIATLGDAEAAKAMRNWVDRLQHQVNRGETLADEFQELTESVIDEGSE